MKVEPRWDGARVVLDTNVWISAALSPEGTPAKLVTSVLEHSRPVFSIATFGELEQRLWKPKFDRYLSMERRNAILHDLGAASEWFEPSPEVSAQRYSRDPDDDKFLWLALGCGATCLVSGDEDLLTLPPFERLIVLTPAQALASLPRR